MSDIVTTKLQELADLRRKILKNSPEQALSVILDQRQPEILVQSFNPEDLHILVKEIGMEDALPVVQMASNAQWEYMLDVESWNKDRLDMQALAEWLRYLYLADADRFVKHALSENLELVEAWLHKNIDMVIRDTDEDLSHISSDFFTIDDTFYVRVKPDADNFMPDSMGYPDCIQFVREFLNRLADEDYGKYQGLLLETQSLLAMETEEELYRIKTGRLEEKGIPSFEDALAIYTMLPEEQLTHRKSTSSNYRINPPLLPTVLAEALPIPDYTLAKLDLPEDLIQEFATLANSILMTDQVKVNEREDMNKAVVKAMGYLHIAFEVLRRDQEISPLQAVNLYATGQLFSFGFSQALKLKWRAQSWLKTSFIAKNKQGVKFYDEEGMGVLSGLFLKRPLYFDYYQPGKLYREFNTLQDINQTAEALEEIMAVDALFNQSPLAISQQMPADDQAYPLTYKNLLLTMWARHALNHDKLLEPLSTAALANFWKTTLFTNGHLQNDAQAKFSAWLQQFSGVETLDPPVEHAINKLFTELEHKYGEVNAADLDAKYIYLFRMING